MVIVGDDGTGKVRVHSHNAAAIHCILLFATYLCQTCFLIKIKSNIFPFVCLSSAIVLELLNDNKADHFER
jgi:hypothetical protein